MAETEKKVRNVPSAGAGYDQAPGGFAAVVDPLLGALVDPETGEIVDYLMLGAPEAPAPAPAGVWREPPIEVLGAGPNARLGAIMGR